MLEPIADNFGAGADMTSSLSYGYTKFTLSTFLVGGGAAGWVEVEREVEAAKNRAVSVDNFANPVGPE